MNKVRPRKKKIAGQPKKPATERNKLLLVVAVVVVVGIVLVLIFRSSYYMSFPASKTIVPSVPSLWLTNSHVGVLVLGQSMWTHEMTEPPPKYPPHPNPNDM